MKGFFFKFYFLVCLGDGGTAERLFDKDQQIIRVNDILSYFYHYCNKFGDFFSVEKVIYLTERAV